MLAGGPPGPDSPDHAIWLEQSWFIRATNWSCIHIGVVIVFACSFLFGSFMQPVFPTLEDTLACFICLCHLVLALSVIWGLRSMRKVTLAYCTADLQMSLSREFRLIACILAPKMLLTFVISTGMLCVGLPRLCYLFMSSSRLLGTLPNSNAWGYIFLAAILGCEGLTFLMMSRFLLEAAVAGRIVEAEIGEVKGGLDMAVVDPDLLTKARTGCGKLAKEILPELAKISGPTLCLAALKGATHIAYVLLWLLQTSRNMDWSFYSCFLTCSLLDLLVGPLCLFLPARVSDAFADLLEILNELRIKPVKQGCSAEVDRA